MARRKSHRGRWTRLRDTGEFGAWIEAPGWKVNPGDPVLIESKTGKMTGALVKARLFDQAGRTLVSLER